MEVRLLTTTYVPEDYSAGQYSANVVFSFEYENTGETDIRAVTGVVYFMDLFRRPIKHVTLTHDDILRSGQIAVDSGKSLEINQFSDEDQWLAVTPRENIVFEFVPQAIIFTDGTLLGSAQ